MSYKWVDRPDREGYWWMLARDGKRTAGFVQMIGNRGMYYLYLIGYREPFNDRDVDCGPLAGSKFKWIPQS